MGDWVVTPRRGKPVEINALWYNALRSAGRLARARRQRRPRARAARRWRRATRESFNRRFWFEDGRYLYDVVDGEHGDDPACRPNQIFSFALRHPVLDERRWPAVLDVVEQRLC